MDNATPRLGVKTSSTRSDSSSQSRADGYVNLTTLLGKRGTDKSVNSSFEIKKPLDWPVLEAMYEQDAIAARIIDRLPDDATREDVTLKGADTDFDFASVQSELEDLEVMNQVGDAWRWARLYRGSLLVMNINDGGKMAEPLNLKTANKLSSLHVIEARFVTPEGFDPGLGSVAFARPERYSISVPFGSDEASARTIHRSRVIRFDGVKVSPSRMIQNGGWGPSVLDRVNTQVTDLGTIMGYASSIMHNLSMQAVQLEGLRDMLCGDAKQQADAKRVIEALQWAMDQLHLIAIDSKDKYIEITRTVSGLKELIVQFIDAVVRATDMPRTVILGEAPGGLNASGDSELRAWYDFVASQQPKALTPALTRILEVIFAIRSKKEKVPDEFTIEYKKLWTPSEKEEAETEKIRTETDDISLQNGTKSVPEVRSDMKARGVLPEEANDEPDTDPLEEELEALKGQMAQMIAAPAEPEAAPAEPEGSDHEPDDEDEPDDGDDGDDA